MRLVFLYYSHKHGHGQNRAWNPYAESKNFFAKRIIEEGYFYLIQSMVEHQIVDEALVVIESRESPGYYAYQDNITCLVVPDIVALTKFIRPQDIIWVRGGFRHWHDWLVEMKKKRYWLLLYAANTGRQKWEFWDVVFDDLGGRDCVDGLDRIHLDFRKPVNEEIFNFRPMPEKWDILIGASRIHDRKGQWRTIDALIAYQELYGKSLKAILPGPFSRGVATNEIIPKIRSHNISVDIVGNLPRKELANVMNSSRVFVGLESHGQGDRGPMEAMACGCPLVIGYPKYHAPWLTANSRYTLVCCNPAEPATTANEIHEMLSRYNPDLREEISEYRGKCAGLQAVILPRMVRLFSYFRSHPVADRQKLAREMKL